MRRVVGVDLSLTGTGVGIITERVGRPPTAAVDEFKTTLTKTGPPDAKGKPTECLADRVRRSRAIANDVWHFASTADLVVIEGIFIGKTAGRLIDRAATWMRVVDRCVANHVPVAVVSPAALKRPIAGSGTADKAVMTSALVRLWPDLEIASDNEVDAIALAHLGAVALGWGVPTLERHRQVTWTEFPDITSAGAVVVDTRRSEGIA